MDSDGSEAGIEHQAGSREAGTLQPLSHIRPGDHLAVRGADQVEGRVLRVDRDGPMVDWGGRLGTVRHPWSEVGARFVRVPRRRAAEVERRRRAG